MTDYERALTAQVTQFQTEWALANGQAVTQPPATPQPIKVNIGGQEMTFNSQKELESAINDTLTKEAQARAVLEQAARSAGAPAPKPAADEKTEFNLAFFKKLEEDPIEAIRMVMDKGVSDPNATGSYGLVRGAAAAAEETRQLVQIAAFKDANPQFNAQMHGQKLDEVRQRLGLPLNAAGLDAAWKTGLGHGAFQLPQQQEQSQSPYGDGSNWNSPNTQGFAPPPPSTSRFTPTPSANMAGQFHSNTTLASLDTMPMDQLAAFMRTQGMEV